MTWLLAQSYVVAYDESIHFVCLLLGQESAKSSIVVAFPHSSQTICPFLSVLANSKRYWKLSASIRPFLRFLRFLYQSMLSGSSSKFSDSESACRIENHIRDQRHK